MEPTIDPKKLTDEQKEKLNKLGKQYLLRLTLNTVKMFGIVCFTSLVIAMINASYVQSETFLNIAGFTNAIFIYFTFSRSLRSEHDKLREETKKILEQ